MNVELPRHVRPKKLASGKQAYYYEVPTLYREMKCPVPSEPLGSDYAVMKSRADVLNGMFDEWNAQRSGLPVSEGTIKPKYGTVDWLFWEYRATNAYVEKVAQRSRSDYEWAMQQICDITTKSGDRIGSRLVKTITPRAADKLYEKFIVMKPRKASAEDGDGSKPQKRLRTGEKMVGLCRKAWKVVQRLFPKDFPADIPNPWLGVTMKTRVKKVKAAVTRDDVYTFAWGAIERGYPEVGATAVICFEWLQRPENVVAGYITWNDYRSTTAPGIIRVAHHKTGTVAPHPLEEVTDDGAVLFYAEAEEVLAKLPRLGVPMILRKVGQSRKERGQEGAIPWVYSSINHTVARLRKQIEGVPAHFTLDACRHGGMTELEEAELTDGQGRALSTHKTQKAYVGYAKRTSARMLSATRKRHAHKIANETATDIRNEAENSIRNEEKERNEIAS